MILLDLQGMDDAHLETTATEHDDGPIGGLSDISVVICV
jgi:hypothetical protein